MNMGYFSTSLYLLWLLWLMFCCSQHIIFHLLGRFPRYLILSGEILKGILFLYSFSNISLLVHRNVTDFRMLILYPATLLNLLICSNSFCVESFGYSIYSNMSLHTLTILPLLFLFGCLLFLLIVWLLCLGLPILCWITMVRVGILVLFPILLEMFSALLHWVLYLLWVCHDWLLLC